MGARATAERLDYVGDLLIGPHLVGRGAGDVEDLAPQRQYRLGFAIARLLGRAAGTVALDQKNFRTGGAVASAVGEFARQPQLARCGFTRELALLPPPLALLGTLGNMIEQQPRRRRVGAKPVIEMILDRVLDQPHRLGRGEPLLGLPLELRISDEQRQKHRRPAGHVFPRRLGAATMADELAIAFDPAQQCAAQTGFVGPAFGSRNGVAVRVIETSLFVLGPRNRPFDLATLGEISLAEEGARGQHRLTVEAGGEEIAEPAGEMQPRLCRNVGRTRQRGVTAPADFETAEQIGLRSRHAIEHGGTKSQAAKDFGVRMKSQGRAPPIVNRPDVLQPGTGLAPAVGLAPEPPIASDLDFERVTESVDHRHADTVQAARGAVGVTAELAAGMQGRQDNLKRGLVWKARMRIDRNPATVVADRDPIAGRELDLDARGMAGHRLVHGVVEHLGGEVMQAALVGAADEHAGAAADRFQPLENLDVLRRIAVGGLCNRGVEKIRHGANITWDSSGASSIRYL